MPAKQQNKGFTLIELMVIISIIGLLSSIVLAALNTARDKAAVAAGQTFGAHTYRSFGADAIASYTFDDVGGTGSILDRSGNGIDLDVVSGSPPGLTTGISGQAYSFNGDAVSPDYLMTTKNFAIPGGYSNNGTWTMMAWIKPSVTPGNTSIYFSASLPYLAVLSGGELYFSWRTGTSSAQTNNNNFSTCNASIMPKAQIGKWQHFAVTSASTTLTAYVNGKEVCTLTTPGASSPLIVGKIAVGNHVNSFSSLYFKGDVDEPNFFIQSLLASDIQKVYAEGLPKHLADK